MNLKAATTVRFQLIAGLTGLNGALNFSATAPTPALLLTPAPGAS